MTLLWDKIALIGAPVGAGAGQRGCAMGPEALRTVGLAQILIDLGHQVRDEGDLTISPAAHLSESPRTKNLPEIAAWAQAISASVYQTMQSGAFPVILGGDHSLSMGSVNGVARHCAQTGKELFVLWLDAHADFNTPDSSPSGNMHGMSLAMLSGEAGLSEVLGNVPAQRVPPANIYLFGLRSVDREERNLLAARGINVVDMRLIDEYGVVHQLQNIISEVQRRNGVLHVSLDVDFLDPELAPGVGTPVAGGATYREAHLIMEMLHDCGLVCSLDLVELNPILDDRGKSARVLVDLVASLFGRSIFNHKPIVFQP